MGRRTGCTGYSLRFFHSVQHSWQINLVIIYKLFISNRDHKRDRLVPYCFLESFRLQPMQVAAGICHNIPFHMSTSRAFGIQ